MFLVRSIRRRLVSLFAVALLLLVCLAAVGIKGLIWHQEAVDDLDFLLHRSPNRDHLSRSVARINESLFSPLDLRREDSVEELRKNYVTHLQEAELSVFEFRRRVDALPPTPGLTLQQRNQDLQRLNTIYEELSRLAELRDSFRVVRTAEQQRAADELRVHAATIVNRIQKTIDTILAYQTRDWVELSLTKERERSEQMLRTLVYGSVIVIVIFVITLLCGFQWISTPVRAIARGCTRIANGDTAHRLPPACRWQDEFADLVAGVNCMADRFQQAEEDLQQKVRERSEQLVRSQKLANVGFLAAGVAHEINNPLSAISVAADSLEYRLYDLIEMETQDAKEIMDRVSMIRRESRRCGDITSRLLDFSRGEQAGRMSADIAELVREVLAMVQHLGKYRDRTVVFEFDRRVVAEVNSAQIKQVILNLVANALQATRPEGVVTICLQEQIDFVVLGVTDDGCGMDSETLHQVFDPFFSTRQTGQGTGLGLSITHRIIEDHGGTITPTSPGLGRGSTFQVRLPRRQTQSNAA